MKKLLLVFMLMLGIGITFSSCSGKKSAIDGYEWLEGKWISDESEGLYSCVIINKDYYQSASYMEDDEVITDVASKPKQEIVIEMYFDRFLQSDVKSFGRYNIDEGKKQIYWVFDFDQKIYMRKIE